MVSLLTRCTDNQSSSQNQTGSLATLTDDHKVYYDIQTSESGTIVYPSNGSNTELFAAKEVRRYIYLRTDQKLTVQGVTSLPSSGDLILVANDNNAMVNSLRGLINHTTAPGGIILKSVNSGGRNILVITGNNS